jgi:hypothetical protein
VIVVGSLTKRTTGTLVGARGATGDVKSTLAS